MGQVFLTLQHLVVKLRIGLRGTNVTEHPGFFPQVIDVAASVNEEGTMQLEWWGFNFTLQN